MRKLLPLIILLSQCVSAQNNNNRLLDQPMKLKTLNITIDADEFTARTFIEMEFYNPNNEEEEGLYRFRLAKGQAITAFQLDLHGKYRDGSIEESWKAQNAYNTIVGKRIDPALLRMEGYNYYSLRIYPIAAKSTRKITMTIEQLLEKENLSLKYQLPFSVLDTVEKTAINISVKNYSSPLITSGLLLGNKFENINGVFHLDKKIQNIQVNRDIIFWIPLQIQSPQVCAKKTDDKTFFAFRYFPSVQKSFPIHPDELTVYWDVSWGGEKRNIKKEIDFLRRYVEKHNLSKVRFITFNQQVVDSILFNTSKGMTDLVDYIYSLSYEGATQFGCLDFSKVNKGVIFVFSDGINSFGSQLPQQGTRPVYGIRSTLRPANSWLEDIPGTSGGSVIALETSDTDQAVRLAGLVTNKLIRVKSLSTGMALTINHPVHLDEILLSGSFENEEADLTLEFGTGAAVAGTNTIKISSSDFCLNSSIDRIDVLRNFDTLLKSHSYEYLLNLGRKERIVTYRTSFIVLERIEDYMRFKILPPKNLEKECDMNLLVKEIKERENLFKAKSEFETLQAVAGNYNNRITKIDKSIALIDLEKPVESDNSAYQKGTETRSVMIKTGAVKQITEPAGENKHEFALAEVVVTALGQTRQPKELGYSVAKVKNYELNPGRSPFFQQGLTGKVSGLQVQTVNSNVFGDTRITLRGIRSLTGNNQPMLVVDGSPVDLRLINQINPNDILEVTVLKSPAATAIYGPEGANGALVLRSRMGNRFSTFSSRPYKYKDCEDMEYIREMNKLTRTEKFMFYKSMKKDYQVNAAFYFDMAENLFYSGLKKEAMEVLFSAAAVNKGNLATIRAIAYNLEYWKLFPEAIKVYSEVLKADSNNIHSWRDLALAYFQNNNLQEAVNTMYQAITRSWVGMDSVAISWKASLLQEMNWIVAANKNVLDLSGINPAILKTIPLDLQITVHSNQFNYSSASLLETNTNKNRVVSYGGQIPQEYQLNEAGNKKYTVRLNYYPYWHDGYGIPTFMKLVCFKYPGTSLQQLEVQTFIMDNQSGFIDIAEIRLNKRR